MSRDGVSGKTWGVTITSLVADHLSWVLSEPASSTCKLETTSIADPGWSLSTLRSPWGWAKVDPPPVPAAALFLTPFGAFSERGLARYLADFLLQPHRPAGRVEHFEKPFKCGHRLGVGRRAPQSLAHQLRGLENGLSLPGLQRIDPENT